MMEEGEQDPNAQAGQEKVQATSVWDKVDAIKGDAPKPSVWDKVDDLSARTNPQINYAIQAGANIDGERAKRILNIQRKVSETMPVPFIDRNLDYLEQKSSEKDFKSDLFFNQDEKLKAWVTENAPKAALIKSDPEEMRRLGLMKLLVERPPSLWPYSDKTIDEQARNIAKLRSARDWAAGRRIDYGMLTGTEGEPTIDYTSQQEMESDYYREELEKRHHIEGIIRGTDEMGPIEGLIARHPNKTISDNLMGLIPIIAHVPKIMDKLELVAAMKAERGGVADEIQKDLAHNARRLEAVSGLRGKSFWGDLGEQAWDFPAMAGEFAIGGGVGRAAMGEAATTLLGKAAQAVAESFISGETVGIPAAAEAFVGRATPKGALGEDKDGNLVFQYSNEKDEPAYVSIPKAGLSSFFDYLAPRIFGNWFAKAPDATQMLARKSLLKTFPLEGLKMIGMNETTALLKGLGGIQSFEKPDIVKAFGGDSGAIKRAFAQFLIGGTSGAAHAVIHNAGLPDLRAKFKAAIDEHLAKQTSEGLDNLNKVAQESVVMQETPGTATDFVKKFSQDGPHEHVYAPVGVWDKYWTSKGVSPREVARAVMGDASAYDEASRLKGDIQIPIADYLTKLGSDEAHGDIFAKEFKLDPAIPSLTQAQEQTKEANKEQPQALGQGFLYDQEVRAAKNGKPDEPVTIPGLTGEAIDRAQKHAEALVNYYENGTILEHADGSRWRVDKTKNGGGFLVLLDENGKETGTTLDLGGKAALNTIARTKEVKPQSAGKTKGQPLLPNAYLDEQGQPTKDLYALGIKGEKADKMQDALDNAMGPGLEKLKEAEIAKRRKAMDKELDALREQVRPQVEEMVNARKDQQALANLTKGTKPDGSPLDEGTPHIKLNRDDVINMSKYGKDVLDNLPKGITSTEENLLKSVDRGTYKDEIPTLMHPDDAADMLGFNSGDELISALMDLHKNPKEDIIKGEMDNLVKEARPDLHQPIKLSETEIEDLKGDNHSKLLKAQWDALVSEDYAKAKGLVKAVDRKPKSIAESREAAKAAIAGKKVRDIKPEQYKSQMEAAGKEAMDAILKGDIPEAADAKQRELDNYEHYKAALEAKKNIKALENWAKRITSKEFQANLGKADPAYLEQFRNIISSLELTKLTESQEESRQTLRDFIAEREANGESLAESVSAPDWILNEANKQNYKDLPYSDFQDVTNLIKQLDRMATTKNKLIAGEKAVEWKTTEGKIVDEIRANKAERPVGSTPSAETFLDKVKSFGRRINASLIKTEQLLKEMTGGNIASELMNRYWHPLADAQAAEYDYTERITAKIAQAIKEMPSEIRDHMRDAVSFKGARKMTRLDLVGIGLNAGNESNLSKLIRGEMKRKGGLTEAQVHEALNMLSAPEIQYINRIHDVLESMKGDISSLHQELTGLPMDEVTPKAMKLENGTIEGGYYPMMYDADESTQGAKQQEARVGDMIQPGYARATMGLGHRLSRVEGFSAPVNFDIDNLPSHIASVVKDITHRRWLLDANKILSSEAIQSAIKDTHGQEVLDRLREVTKEVVNDRNQPSLKSLATWRRLVSGFRTNTAIVATGFKIGTLLEHTFSIGAGIDALGGEYFAKGMEKTLQSPKQAFKAASEKSGEIRHFLENGNRDIRDKLRDLEGRSDVLANAQRTAAYAIGFANLMRALPIWHGAYEKALAELPESHGFKGDELEKYAVRSADQVLRLTVGTAGAKDLSAVQSGARGGDIMKLFTMFYTPGAVLYSRLHDIGHEASRTKDIPRALVRAFWVVPFAATMQALAKGDFPRQDKDETWAGWWVKNNATYPFSSVPIVRDIANTAAYGRDSAVSTPGTEAMRGILDTADYTKRAMEGEGTAIEAAEKGWNTFNSFYGLPTKQLQTIGDYLMDLEKGETQSNNILELYRNLLHYKHQGKR